MLDQDNRGHRPFRHVRSGIGTQRRLTCSQGAADSVKSGITEGHKATGAFA